MKHRLNSGKLQTSNVVDNPERSPKGNVQRLFREEVDSSESKQAAPLVGEDIVRTLPRGKAVYVCIANLWK